MVKPAAARFIATAACALALAASARADTEHTSFALPSTGFFFSAIYLAQDLGIFAQEGLDVSVVPVTGVGATNAVISGSVDFTLSSGVTLTRAAARGQKLLGLANLSDRGGMWVVLRKDVAAAGHFDPASPLAARGALLQDRKMAVAAINAIPHAYLRIVAKAGGVDPERGMEVAGMAPPDMVSALARGAIDGFVGGAPFIQKVVQDGTAVILANGANPMEPADLAPIAANVLVTRPQLCVANRPLCAKMGDAMEKVAQAMHQHPDEAIAALKKRFGGIDDGVFIASYRATEDMTPNPPIVTAKELENADRMNIEAGFLKPSEKLDSYDGLFTNDFVH
ncbi:MAG TPA: ABC transporter substrate-binding protein [Stellaceae bacterium]|nr:ABC transporter substrate-binding protein [Stellaceae bacterium]